MMRFLALMRSTNGAAAAEMAIVTPLLVIILAALAEAGYYFYSEHRLVESVRDAARYAARQPFGNYASCPSGTGTTDISGTATGTNAKLIAQKGSLNASATDRLWGWGETGESFTVTYRCFGTVTATTGGVGNQTMGGIYQDVVGGAPVVTVDASLPHNGVFAAIGFNLPLEINAEQQASVAGI